MTDQANDKDVAFIKALAELLRENDLTELQVKREYGEQDWINVRVARQMQAAPVMAAAPAVAPAAAPAAVAAPAKAP